MGTCTQLYLYAGGTCTQMVLVRRRHFVLRGDTAAVRFTGDMEDLLGSLPEYALESQAWEDYRPPAAPQPPGPHASTSGPLPRGSTSEGPQTIPQVSSVSTIG